MSNPLTIAYLTNRKKPHIEWFAQSLARQVRPDDLYEIIIVDYWAEPIERDGWTANDARDRQLSYAKIFGDSALAINHVAPKPTVWAGPHRLTKENWFSAASVRNTALCLTETPFLAYVDDLSVLGPDWMEAARTACAQNYVGLGSYRKVQKLIVENGEVKSFQQPIGVKESNGGFSKTEFNIGDDTRLAQVTQDVTPCDGGWLYGCSLVGPVEDFLKVGGWPEDLCDGLSSEDCCMGKAMKNAGVDLRYCRKMLTFESEEGHGGEPGEVGFKKADKGPAGTESDKSHRALRIAEKSAYFHNMSDIPRLRNHMVAGGKWPPPKGPTNDWFDGEAIADFK